MKARLGLFLLFVTAYAAQAQEVDDMYFNSKDRAKERAARQKDEKFRHENLSEEEQLKGINPTDSYSSRKVNPEYSSQQKTNSGDNESPEYFLSGYQPTGVNQKFNNSYYAPGAFASPYYGNSGWGNPYMAYSNGFGSPYSSFGSPYSNWNDPFNSYGYGYPYGSSYGSSWSLTFGNSWGSWYPYSALNSWGSGFYGNSYYGCNPYNSWASGGGWNSWGSPYGYNYYSRYPTQVIIVNNDGSRPRVVYGKRTDRSSSLNNPVDHTRAVSSFTRPEREVSRGRTSTQTNEQSFYDRNWKKNPEVTQNGSRSFWTNSSTTRSYNGNSNTPSSSRSQVTNTWGNDHNNSNNSRSWSSGNSNSSNHSSGSRTISAPSHSSGGATRTRGRD